MLIMPRQILSQVAQALKGGSEVWALAMMNEYDLPPALRYALIRRANLSEDTLNAMSPALRAGTKLAKISGRERKSILAQLRARPAPRRTRDFFPLQRFSSEFSLRENARSSDRSYASSRPVRRRSSMARSYAWVSSMNRSEANP